MAIPNAYHEAATIVACRAKRRKLVAVETFDAGVAASTFLFVSFAVVS